jgi:vacuolar protein-sorting-associated protein 4
MARARLFFSPDIALFFFSEGAHSMDTQQFLDEAALACQRGNQHKEAGETDDAINYFVRALQMYSQVQHSLPDDPESMQCKAVLQTKAVIQGQCDKLMDVIEALRSRERDDEQMAKRVKALRVDEDDDELEDDELTTASSSTVSAARSHAAKPESGHAHDHYRVDILATRFSAERLSQTRWTDVVGMDAVKQELRLHTKLRREMPDLFADSEAGACMLLYGPPGTGKTHLARALACECGVAFFAPTTADLVTKYLGDSARYIRALFEVVREAAPAVLFLDEIDGLVPSRESHNLNEESKRGVNELLTQMDGVGRGALRDVIVIGATNRPWVLDAGFRRRMPERFYVPLPDLDARHALLVHESARYRMGVGDGLRDDALHRLAALLDGYSGSDIAALFRAAYKRSVVALTQATHYKQHGAFIMAVDADDDDEPSAREAHYDDIKQKERLRPVALDEAQLLEAMARVRASGCDADELAKYAKWTLDYGTHA